MRRNDAYAKAQHAQHAGPHTYMPTSATGTPTEQHTTKPITHRSQHGGGRRWRFARFARVQNARLTCRAGHGFRGVGTAQPGTYRPERTWEGEAEREGERAALLCVTKTIRYADEKKSHLHLQMHELTRALRCSGTRTHTYVHTCTFRLL